MLASEPLVSIVTPCLNAAPFLEAAIQSVLSQDYPAIEYIVMDGGSSDGSVDILKRYDARIDWVSQKDAGTADAINKGFERAQGEVFAYLNADDLLKPGAVRTAVAALVAHPEAAGVYGAAEWIDEGGVYVADYPVRDFDPKLLETECFISQPASFVRRDAFLHLGGLDPTLALTFDYDFWMRLARVYSMRRIPETLASSRMHSSNKSLGRKREVFEETFRVMRRHYGYIPFSWVYSYICYLADGRDQFFEPLKPSFARYVASLPKGLALNPGALTRYVADWSGVGLGAILGRK